MGVRETLRDIIQLPSSFRRSRERHTFCQVNKINAVFEAPKAEAAKKGHMLHYSLLFLVVALVAGLLGFWGIAGAAAGVAKILFFVFLAIFLISLLFGRRRV